MTIRYRIDATQRDGHRARGSVEIPDVRGPTVDLGVPIWVPGSYHVVNYVRGFRDVVARNAADGTPLRVDRVEGSRWRVHADGATTVRFDYTVYGHDLVTEAFDLTADHLFLNAALALPFVDGRLHDPVEVELHLPRDWKVVTELEEVRAQPPTYRAPSYDELVDNPLDAGHPLVVTIRPRGIPHRISLCGEGGNYELHRIEEDLGRIAEAAMRLLGDSPLPSYTFFVHLTDRPDGGLEHACSNSVVVPRTTFRPTERYERFLSLESHEYFHLYNVKRIRPKVLGPFDYARETYTGLLWWMEGTTDYFSDLVLRRAGLYTPSRYLEEEAKVAKELLETPGRRSLSLEDLSRIAWVDYYQRFEETPNQSVSYYTKGHVVSLCLDWEIRHRTETRASLETVLRRLWTDYGKVGRGLEEDELQRVAERATELDLDEFFSRYVRGTEEIDLDRFARFAGLTFGPKPKAADDRSPTPGYLGVRVQAVEGSARVTNVFVDAPGARAGLSPGDEIVAIDGTKVAGASWPKELEGFPPGSEVELTLFRRGFLRRLGATLGTPPPEKYQYLADPDAAESAKRVYESWMGAPWEPAPARSPTP